MPTLEGSSAAKKLPLSDSVLIAALRLARTPGIGSRTFHALLNSCGTAEAALAALPSISRKPITLHPEEAALAEIAATEKFGARMIPFGAPEYPAPLAALEDAPPVLVARGRLELLQKPMIAIVGARNASLAGCRFTENLARELGAAGQVVVSGLARGIDTAAHKAALASGTVAVIAGGIDTLYPPENKKLQQQIFEEGLVLAELPLGSTPRAEHFPQRNRIIAGLSAGTIVVEAAVRSGSLITARLAGEFGRDVFAVPGSPLDARAEGPNKLIKQGAMLVESAEDVLKALATPLRRRMERPAPPQMRETPAEYNAEKITNLEDEILESLSYSPLPADEILSAFAGREAELHLALLRLELSGKIERHPGGALVLAS